MISVQTIVSKIYSETGYTTQFARSADQDLLEVTEGVRISVGYGPIRSSNPEQAIAYSAYELQGENNIQSFYVVICCTADIFDTVFKNVYKALKGYNPSGEESLHTSFTFSNGEPLGFNNTMFLFRQEWKIGFPTNSIL